MNMNRLHQSYRMPLSLGVYAVAIITLCSIVTVIGADDNTLPGIQANSGGESAPRKEQSVGKSSFTNTGEQGGVSQDVPLTGRSFLIHGLDLKMLSVSEGSFYMGSLEDKIRIRTVISKPFWLGETKVSQAQWRAVTGRTMEQQRDKANPSLKLQGVGADYPIYYVSWPDAMEFCKVLTERESAAGRLPNGYQYVLPTSAQWEYACRAGTETTRYFGELETGLADSAWYDANSGGTSHSVGQKRPNPWNFYDMYGNGLEWCLDGLGTLTGMPIHKDGTKFVNATVNDLASGACSFVDTIGPTDSPMKALRSARWDQPANFCRSAFKVQANASSYVGGLRIALCSEQK